MPDALLILLNPHAASGRALRLVAPIEAWARKHPARPRLHVAGSVDESLAVLRALPPASRVAAVGGDGTIHKLLPALLERRHMLGIVACGTGNDTARALGAHRLRWPAALELTLSAAPQPIDVAMLRTGDASCPFVSSLAAGFDAAVAIRALQASRALPGTLRYLWATLAELKALQGHRLRAECDGALVHDGDALFASTLNTRSYGSGMPAVPQARIDDARLDLLIAGRFGRAGVLAMLPLLLAGLHLHHPRVRSHAFTTLRIRADAPLPLAADGEPLAAAAEFEVSVLAGALSVARRAVAQHRP
jgi:diacylglycerol kinase family enzyme